VVSSSPLNGRADDLRRALVVGDMDRLPPFALFAFDSPPPDGRDVEVRRALAEGDLDPFMLPVVAVALGDFDVVVLVLDFVVGEVDLDLLLRGLAEGDLLLDFTRSAGVELRGRGLRSWTDASILSFSSRDPDA
jgi:hypothetical protein